MLERIQPADELYIAAYPHFNVGEVVPSIALLRTDSSSEQADETLQTLQDDHRVLNSLSVTSGNVLLLLLLIQIIAIAELWEGAQKPIVVFNGAHTVWA